MLRIDLKEKVYMSPPPGFEAHFANQVRKLRKSLYGLNQSLRAWFDRLPLLSSLKDTIKGTPITLCLYKSPRLVKLQY